MSTESQEVTLTPKELATRWKVSERTVRRGIEKKTLPHFKILGSIRIPLNFIEQYEKGEIKWDDYIREDLNQITSISKTKTRAIALLSRQM